MQLLTIAASAALFVAQASAKPTFLALIPGSKNVAGVNAIGHVNPKGGGEPNAFGEDFEEAKATWTVDLCYKDSDSDGQFNGAELGDPCCEWVKGTNEKLAYKTATAPGDKTSKQDPTIWASVKCVDGSSPEAKFKAYSAKAASGSGNGTDEATVTTVPTTTEPVPASTTVAPAETTTAPSATPAPTTKSGAAQVAAAASAVAVTVAAFFA